MTNQHLPPIRSRGPRHLKRLVKPTGLLLLFGALIWGAVSCISRVSTPPAPLSKAEEYPGAWETVTPAIYRAIYIGGHRCVEGYMRTSVKNEGEHLVYCHEQAGVWTSYLVWSPSDRVLGPDRSFAYTSGVPLPERDPDAVWMDTAP